MSAPRRSFTRDDPETRRASLIAAALDLMAEDGPQAATVRAIADAAGLSQGMIRHYFSTKEELINAAYQAHMEAQLTATRSSLPADGTAMARLARIITVSLTPPVSDPRTLSLWAAFIHMIRRDPDMLATHERNYLRFRDLLESLIVAACAESGRPVSKEEARHLAIACNAVLDGLWLEGGALPEAFAPGELEQIGMTSVSAILGVTLKCEAT